jgi:hypothetical protein
LNSPRDLEPAQTIGGILEPPHITAAFLATSTLVSHLVRPIAAVLNVVQPEGLTRVHRAKIVKQS